MIVVRSWEKRAEERVKRQPALSVDGATDSPDERKQKQGLQPESYLQTEKKQTLA